jgi:multiple sugar transport system permease protein
VPMTTPSRITHHASRITAFWRLATGDWRLTTRQQEALAGYICLIPWFIGFAVFTVGAMLFSLGLSLFETTLLTPPRFVGLDNYAQLPTDPLFLTALRNTAYYTGVSVPVGLALALGAALLLHRDLPGIALYRALYYLPAVVPGVAATLLWAWILQPREGLVNMTLRAIGLPGPPWLASEEWVIPGLMLISIWSFGEGMVIFLAGLQGIPRDLYEAAAIDGAGPVVRFRHVTLPMLTPAILFGLVTGVIGSFQVFTASFLTTGGGPNNASLTLVLYLYTKGFKHFEFGYASAIAWVMFALILIWTLLVLGSARRWVYYEADRL